MNGSDVTIEVTLLGEHLAAVVALCRLVDLQVQVHLLEDKINFQVLSFKLSIRLTMVS